MEAALTETQGLELVLGVGERCTVTSAIQRPGSGHLRGSNRGEKSIIVLRERKPSRTRAVCLLPVFLPSSAPMADYLTTPRLFPLVATPAHAQLPMACQSRLTVCVLDINEVMSGVCQQNNKLDTTDLALKKVKRWPLSCLVLMINNNKIILYIFQFENTRYLRKLRTLLTIITQAQR